MTGDDLELISLEGGSRMRLRVKAGARREGINGLHGGALKLTVTAPPERGKANRAVLALLAKALEVAPSSLTMLSGASSPDKTVLVPLAPEAIRNRLDPRLRRCSTAVRTRPLREPR